MHCQNGEVLPSCRYSCLSSFVERFPASIAASPKMYATTDIADVTMPAICAHSFSSRPNAAAIQTIIPHIAVHSLRDESFLRISFISHTSFPLFMRANIRYSMTAHSSRVILSPRRKLPLPSPCMISLSSAHLTASFAQS